MTFLSRCWKYIFRTSSGATTRDRLSPPYEESINRQPRKLHSTSRMSSTTTTTTRSSSSTASDPLAQLSSLVSPSEIISPSSPEYTDNTQPWSHHHDQHPRLVLRPNSLDSLSKIVAFLGKSHLDFKVRSQGYGNASAKDVLISLTAFDQFEWDNQNKVVTLGPGAPWNKYYEQMQKVAPDYAIVSARTPSIGVGGSTLCSGFSWLSAEYGCVSDPANMLDAQVVKLDGSIVWASTEPDLLWALRGTETGFGIVTAFKFQARPYPENGNIWAGAILIPRDQVPVAAKGIMSMFDVGEVDPKVSMFLYVMRKEMLYLVGADTGQDVLVIHCYDGKGEQHGRKTFKWALDIEGAIDQTTGGMTGKSVADLQAPIGTFRGHASTYWSPLALSSLSEEIILNAFDWWTSILDYPNSVSQNNWLLFELFSCRDNLTGRHSSAWPRPVGYKHMVLLGTGAAKDASEEELRQAREKIIAGPSEILGQEEGEKIGIVPNGVHPEVHDVKRIYGEHYNRLCEIKRRYDPGNRLKGHFKP